MDPLGSVTHPRRPEGETRELDKELGGRRGGPLALWEAAPGATPRADLPRGKISPDPGMDSQDHSQKRDPREPQLPLSSSLPSGGRPVLPSTPE